jgi:hypothetical protein
MVIKMKTENQEELINDEGDALAETLADLPVTDEQARHAKGGPDDMPIETVSLNYGNLPVRFRQ